MAKATKICKVCGVEYEYCHTFRRDTIFRWQDVACCVEHGNQYFAAIATSREEVAAVKDEPVMEENEILEDNNSEEDIVPVEQVAEFTVSKNKKSRK